CSRGVARVRERRPRLRHPWREGHSSRSLAGPLPRLGNEPRPVVSAPNTSTTPVTPRPCGDCGMCCKLPDIAELNNPDGVWGQPFKVGSRCTIYADRPQVCRIFQCVWSTDPQLTDEWRPDRSKFVLKPHQGTLIVLTDPRFPDAWRQAPYYSQFKSWSHKH